MRSYDRVAVLLRYNGETKWLDAATRRQLERRGWFSERLQASPIEFTPYVALRTKPSGKFDRSVVIDALNRSMAEFSFGESLDSSYTIIALHSGMDRFYLALWTSCGMFPDTKAPAPPYLAGIDLVPEWATPEAIAALTTYWRAATATKEELENGTALQQ